jgi:hypothetical protein
MSNFLIDEDTDLLAAEFVLGTLDSQERANAQSQLRTDHGFIAMVRIWERRFGELHLMVEPVEPNAKIWERIRAKVTEISPGGPAPDAKLPTAVTPSLEPPEATGPSAGTPAPADAVASGEAPKPQDVPEVAISEEKPPEMPPEVPPAAAAVVPTAVVSTAVIPAAVVPTVAGTPAAAEVEPKPESQPSEAVAKPEPAQIAKIAIPPPPPVPPPPLKFPQKLPDKDQRPVRRPEITIDVIRSRSRWRLLGVSMSLLLIGLAGLLAAWRFAPDHLPARLRPAELLMSVGIQSLPTAASTEKPAPPVSGFDE